MTEFGSLGWARATGGRLDGLTRLRELWRLAVAQVRLRPRPEGFSAADLTLALRETAIPDTPLVAASHALVASLGPPALVGHVVRTYVWGTLLGLRDGLTWDHEVFATAALLHDVALARRRHEFTCFAHDGAEQALEFLSRHEVEPSRRGRIAEAICLHLRVDVPRSLGVEAHLVHAGAGVDVVGRRLGEVEPRLRTAVLQRHPRLDLVEVLERAFREERSRHPDSRIGVWLRAGFLSAVRRNPLSRET